jgi:hypothetical protein
MVALARPSGPNRVRLEDLEVGATVSDYEPVSRKDLIALVARAAASLDDGAALADIHARLGKGIRGMTSPTPIEGPIAERLSELDRIFVSALESRKLEGLVEQLEQLLS